MYSYSYTYYDDGKLETEKHIVAGATEQPVIKYTYDNNGNVVSKVLSNGSNETDVKVTSSYSYNLANECVTEVHNNGTGYNYEYNYTYNPDGNVAKSTLIKREKKIKTIYTYDRLNRLTSEKQQQYNKGDLSDEFKDVYSFDDYNNILKKVHTEDDTTKNSTVVSTYDKTRLLTQTETDSENNQSSQISYTYDDNGNMSSKALVKGENTTETQFSYDGFDRTTGIKIGDVTTSFDYNTDSDRVSKTTNGKTTESILDNGSVSADLIGETLKVFSKDNSVFCQNGVFAYNVINTKGDIIALAGSNGIDYNYNAYGTELYKYSSANPIGYRNYYYDSETGLYYLKARYYDPTTGQFTQEDTVQDDNLQYNLYGYCSANPVLYFDADGHKKKKQKQKQNKKSNTYNGTAADFRRLENNLPPIDYSIEMQKKEWRNYFKISSTSTVGKNIKNVDYLLMVRLFEMGKAYKQKSIIITNGYRTNKEQTSLYKKKLAGIIKRASQPGYSWHEYGGAVDIRNDVLQGKSDSDFKKYKLCRPAKGESWHIQIIENNKGSYTTPAKGKKYFKSITKWGSWCGIG